MTISLTLGSPIRPLITISRIFSGESPGAFSFEAVFQLPNNNEKIIFSDREFKSPFDAIAAARKQYPASVVQVHKAILRSYRDRYQNHLILK